MPTTTEHCQGLFPLLMQIGAFLSVLESTNSLVAAYANATAYIPSSAYTTGFASTTACPSTSTANNVANVATPWGFATAVGTVTYDFALFSYVGCRCNPGYDNIYSVDDAGKHSTTVAKKTA